MQAYGVNFVQKVQHKHFLAQHYFLRIPKMAEEIEERVQKLPLPQPKEKEIIVHMRGVEGVGVATEEQIEGFVS